MKADIHPKYEAAEIKCSCGNIIQTRSTRKTAMHLDVCNLCHPFYTGEQRIVDTAGRVERFNRRYQRLGQ
jgi:large subunit ribosomal protein L31